MKKHISLIIVFLLAIGLLSGCSNQASGGSSSSSASLDSLKTMGDVFRLDSEEYQTSTYEDKFIYAFKIDDTYYRAITTIDEETSKALFALDFDDPDYDTKYEEMLNKINIDEIENLSEKIIPQDELDKLVGKTSEELIADGWRLGSGYNLEELEIWMEKDAFNYTVKFEGDLSGVNEDTFSEEDLKGLTVKSITYNSLGDATYME